MSSKSRRLFSRQAWISFLVLATVARAAQAQTPTDVLPFNQASDNLGSVLRSSSQKVLGTCQSWPPRLAKKPGDQNKKLTDSGLADGTDIITGQLASVLNIKPDVKPYVYDASFLRMLDSVSTFDPGVPNSQLLGIAVHVDPSQLQLWGTSTSTVKYDCLSMLSLAAQAGGGFSIPFFSLNAAFQASQSVSSNQTSTFFFGTLQSPFDYMYHSADPSQRLFAALKALEWRLNNGRDSDSSQDQYVATAQFLTVERGSAASERTSFLGNMKAGVTFPLANLSSQISGQYTTSLQANSTSYITYFWSPKMKSMENVSALTRYVANSLPQMVPDANELTAGTTVNASTSVSGWPDELCLPGAWTLITKNSNFSASALAMTGATTNGWPTCTIKASFSFPGQNTKPSSDSGKQTSSDPNQQKPSDLASPQLYLVSATNSNVSIPLSVYGTFHSAGAVSATVEPVRGNWDSDSQKSELYWTISGDIDLPKGRVVSSKEIKTAEFTCKTADGSPLQFDSVEFDGAPKTTPRIKKDSDTDFTIYASVSLLSVHKYDSDANQADKKTCAISGAMHLATTDSGGKNSSNDLVNFKTTVVYFPNELTVPVTPTNVSATAGTAQVSLTWTGTQGAIKYNIYRGTAQNTEVLLKSGVQDTSYSDTSLASGTTYYYKVTAVNSVGESPRSNETNATPK